MTADESLEQKNGLGRLRRWAKHLKESIGMCLVAISHPEVGLPARVILGVTLAYAVSPIDLIPDFVPLLGLLDDLILVPIGIWLAIRMIPAAVVTKCRARVRREEGISASSRLRTFGLVLVILLWVFVAYVLFALFGGQFMS